jgi:hypothetical protein
MKWPALALAVFVIGLLILIPSGLCTGIFGIMAIVGSFRSPEDAIGLMVEALAFGGPFIAVGVGLVTLGRRMRERGGK